MSDTERKPKRVKRTTNPRLRDVRGRTAKGADPRTETFAKTDLIGLRMTSHMIEAIDDWCKDQPEPISRSEAMRCLINFALFAGPTLEIWANDEKHDIEFRKNVKFLLSKYKAVRESYRLK